MGVPFSWNLRSPSDPLSSRTLMIVLLGWLLAECSILYRVCFLVASEYLAFAILQLWPFILLHFWRRSSHYWAGHPTVLGPTVCQLSHSVFYLQFLPQDFLILFRYGTWNSSIIQFRFFWFFIKIFKYFEFTGFEIILSSKFKFILDFKWLVIPFFCWEEVSWLTQCLRAFFLLQEHSLRVLCCSQLRMLESLLSFEYQHKHFLICCSIFCWNRSSFSILHECCAWICSFNEVLLQLQSTWCKMLHFFIQIFGLVWWAPPCGVSCVSPCFSHGVGCFASFQDRLCGWSRKFTVHFS